MDTFSRAIRITWNVIRFPLIAILAFCEPLLGIVLGGLAILMLVAAAVYAGAVPFRALPVYGLLIGAIALIVVRALFSAVVRVLSG
jgi:hypothetical protein